MSESTCPNCGYCKHCGRGGHQVAPWQIQPVITWHPRWWDTTTNAPSLQPQTVTTSRTTRFDQNANITWTFNAQ